MLNSSRRRPRIQANASPGRSRALAASRQFLRLACVGAGLLLLSTIVLSPMLAARGVVATHEIDRYFSLHVLFLEAFCDGVWYPRWMARLAGGYGYPTFVFYQPLFFFVSTAYSLLNGGLPTASVLLALVTFILIGLSGAYALGRLEGHLSDGFFVAALFALTPYVYVNLYVRGDYSELAGMMLSPWPLVLVRLLARRMSQNRRGGWLAMGLACALAALPLAHPAVGLMMWPVVLAMSVAAACSLDARARRRFAVLVAASFVFALGLSCVYWMPVFTMREHVQLENATAEKYRASRHTVDAAQLFSNGWGFGESLPDSADDTISFALSLPHFVIALVGLWLGRRQAWSRGLAVCYLGSILFMTHLAAPLWDRIDLLRLIQFPWRLLAVTGAVQAASAANWSHIPALKGIDRRWIMIASVLLTAAWQHRQFQRDQGTPPAPISEIDDWLDFRLSTLELRDETFTGTNEFAPRWAKTPTRGPRGDAPLMTATNGANASASSDTSLYRLRYRVTTTTPADAIIEQFYFPGWVVEIDGRRVDDDRLRSDRLDDGRMRVRLPAHSEVLVEAWYAGPPCARWRWLAAIVSGVVFVAAGMASDRMRGVLAGV